MDRVQGQRGQDGAVVIEFAVVFVLFATLLAGLIQYGTIFAVQQSLSHAAAEATRSAVDVVGTTDAQDRAQQVLDDQLDWLDAAGVGSTIQSDVPCDPAIYPAGTNCLEVEVTYDWDNHAIVPMLVAVAVPDTLRSRAVIIRD